MNEKKHQSAFNKTHQSCLEHKEWNLKTNEDNPLRLDIIPGKPAPPPEKIIAHLEQTFSDSNTQTSFIVQYFPRVIQPKVVFQRIAIHGISRSQALHSLRLIHQNGIQTCVLIVKIYLKLSKDDEVSRELLSLIPAFCDAQVSTTGASRMALLLDIRDFQVFQANNISLNVCRITLECMDGNVESHDAIVSIGGKILPNSTHPYSQKISPNSKWGCPGVINIPRIPPHVQIFSICSGCRIIDNSGGKPNNVAICSDYIHIEQWGSIYALCATEVCDNRSTSKHFSYDECPELTNASGSFLECFKLR